MRIDREFKREGFSLIELIIAVAVAAIVMSAVLLLITYSSNSMNRTSTAVNVQNQAKDATMHITSYLQEGTDAHADPTNHAVIIVNEKKDAKGVVDSADVEYYWYNSADKAIYFKKFVGKTEYKNASNTNAVLPVKDANDKIDFSDLEKSATDYEGWQTKDNVFVQNCIEFTCKENPGTVDIAVTPDPAAPTTPPGVTPTASPAPEKKAIGGKSFTIKMALKSENDVAEFTCDKTVYLRNQ